MIKRIRKIDEKIFETICCKNSFRRGDVFTMVLGAAIGSLVLIGFYLICKEVLGDFNLAAKNLVSM